MATPRMRRINEVLREVVGATIATELSDPRIGFVTVTSVETSPDLRAAKVHVSVLGDEDAARGDARGPALLARRDPVADRRRDADEADADAELPLRPDRRVGDEDLAAARRRGGGRVSEAAGAVASEIERVVAEVRDRDRFLLTAHEGPDGDALGSLLGMHHLLTQLGKDSLMFMAAKEFPLPIEYRFLPLEEVFHEPPADMADRTVVFLDCGNIDRMPVDFLTRRAATSSSTSTTTTTTPASATSTWSTPPPPAPPRSSTSSAAGSAAGSPRRSPRRSTSAWSPTRASSCTRTPTPARTGSPPT